ncbi:ABC transporter permease [Acidimangrovimonas sediminis]|uniref:ABC transporter permease n=1 Tax=Acidimangrovimonas sediminis TaxID=2056283 RepID=UPI000C7FFC5A|nr:ABC transporter permease [Acidimangrovimonas sediminis]
MTDLNVETAIAPAPRRKVARRGPIVRALGRFGANRYAMTGLAVFGLTLAAVVLMPFVWKDPNGIDLLAINKPPGAGHPLGTDGIGRDVLARLLAGGRVSLLVAGVSTLLSTALGFFIGALAPFGGRFADAAIMRVVDLAMTLPPVILLLVLASITGPGIVPTIAVISLLSWPLLSRMVRSRLLELRERDFIIFARGAGAGPWHLVMRHGLPNTIDILVVYATLQVANAILLEAGLSFLGLGVPPPAASWGNMLNAARSTVVLQSYPWQWMFAGGAIVLTVVCINLIGDGLRDAFDPRADLE